MSFGDGAAGDHDAGFTSASDGWPFKGATGMSDALGLSARGIYRANVTVTMVNFSDQKDGYTQTFEQFKNLNLTMSRQTSVLVGQDRALSRENAEAYLPAGGCCGMGFIGSHADIGGVC